MPSVSCQSTAPERSLEGSNLLVEENKEEEKMEKNRLLDTSSSLQPLLPPVSKSLSKHQKREEINSTRCMCMTPGDDDDDGGGDDEVEAVESSSSSPATSTTNICEFPRELQVNILTYLRAYDLASVHQTCRYYRDPILVHACVVHAAERVYPYELTKGFEQQPVMTNTTTTTTMMVMNNNNNSTTTAAADAATATTTPPSTIKIHNKDGNNGGRRKGNKKNNVVSTQTPSTPTTTSLASSTAPATAADSSDCSILFTFEHLRNMELLVVARVLSRPEPVPAVAWNHPDDDAPAANDDDDDGYSASSACGGGGGSGGYYVSKSWCKTALKWLEWQQERQQQYAAAQQQQQQQQLLAAAATSKNTRRQQQKKISKKQQRLNRRKYSDASNSNSNGSSMIIPPPGPNVNSDIVCCHDQLQLCSNRKSARARRKLLDKQAWKCLKKLYPESIPLEVSQGECVQCLLQINATKRQEQLQKNKERDERKAPLAQAVLRRFYTRTRGVPMHCLISSSSSSTTTTTTTQLDSNDDKDEASETMNAAFVATSASSSSAAVAATRQEGMCPLIPGTYYAIPRAWCHAWRKYMKTGEGGQLCPPDASSLLCSFHRLPLLPPHLESYLYGEAPQLWCTNKALNESNNNTDDSVNELLASPSVARRSVVGLSPSSPSMEEMALPAVLGLSPAQVAQQQRAMMTLEREQRQREAQNEAIAAVEEQGHRSSLDLGKQLDRENYCCVEILAHDELEALEKLWPRAATAFRLGFEVLPGQNVVFSTLPCRECDASGMANLCKIPKSKAHLRAAHQSRVRIYKDNKTGSSSGKPTVQLEY